MNEALQLLIRSGNPLIAIGTPDEHRAIQIVEGVAKQLGRPSFVWSMTDGLCDLDSSQPETYDLKSNRNEIVGVGTPVPVLKQLRTSLRSAIYVFKDLGPHCKDAMIHRMIRDLLPQFEDNKATMILLDSTPLPEEINRFTIRFEIPWPTEDELTAVVKETYKRIQNETTTRIQAKISKREMEQLVQSLRGLTCREASRVISSAIHDDDSLDGSDLPKIIEAKRTLLGATGCLESIAADFSSNDIGGLKNLKNWLQTRRGGFSPQAQEFGIEAPRGVLMLGVPGCGKSLCAKVVAADWHMPLLRLDPGVLYQKFIGESESQLRQALRQAESMAPAILWIDEIEKAFASASASSADGGLSKRMFGTLLSWMQDHRHPIFIVATANDVSAVPPELMRKGRFDEVFFVDLPDQHAREQILNIHLRRRNRDPENFNIPAIADKAQHFSGSELEQAVNSALFSAFTESTELADWHLIQEIQKTRPLAVLTEEKVERLRAWAHDRCVPAD